MLQPTARAESSAVRESLRGLVDALVAHFGYVDAADEQASVTVVPMTDHAWNEPVHLRTTAAPQSGGSIIAVGIWHTYVFARRTAAAPCAHCLQLRLAALASASSQLSRSMSSATTATAQETKSAAMAAPLVDGLSRLVSGHPNDHSSTTLARVRLADLSITSESLPRSPWCGHHLSTAPSPPRAVPDPSPARQRSAGFRAHTASDLIARAPLVRAFLTGGDGGEPRHHLDGLGASVTGAFSAHDERFFTTMSWGGHADSFRESEAVGLLEATERLATLRPAVETATTTARLAELGTGALDPNDLVDDQTLRTDPRLLRHNQQDWVSGRSLVTGDPRSVTVASAYFYDDRYPSDWPFATSNGCAAGASFDEAALHGCLELVERDAFIGAWYAGVPLPVLDPSPWRSKRLLVLDANLRRLGYQLTLLDARNDVDVPVVVAIASRRDGGLGAYTFGSAASLSPQRAAEAAAREAAFRVKGFPEATRAMESQLRKMAEDFGHVKHLGDHARLFGLPEMRARSGPALGWNDLGTPTDVRELYRGHAWDQDRAPAENLDLLVDRVRSVASDVITIDYPLTALTNDAITVVRVIAPGLVPADFGWDYQRALHMPRLHALRLAAGLTPLSHSALLERAVPHPLP